MTRALLCCSSVHEVIGSFNRVWSVGTLTELGLSSREIRSQNLFDVELPDIDAQLRHLIETGLQKESSTGKANACAEIAFQHVHWRFVRYYQYRLRLEKLINRDLVTHLTLSSAQDCDLVQACQAACSKYNIELNVQSGPCDTYSSKLAFLATYDLPSGVKFLDSLASPLLAAYYRLNKAQTFYQPYNNLGDGYFKAAVLTWRRSLCLTGQTLPSAEPGHPRCIVNMDVVIHSNPGINFDPQAWPRFDRFDIAVLVSAFGYFHGRYNVTSIDMLYKRSCKFFEQSRTHRIVLNSDNTCTSRLLSKAARTTGMQIDYLPHGLTFEDLSLDTGTSCGVDRILAWNRASAAAYERLGRRTEVISHPSNKVFPSNKRRLPRKYRDLRVLIMPPEWVGLSFSSRPDCFERDILDVLAALHHLDVPAAKIKLHNSIPAVLQAKIKMLDAIRPYAAIDFCLIDSNIPAQKLYEQFDLIIIGPTTGLLEASRSTTPFIGFRAFMHKAGVFSDTQFPSASTIDELVHCIKSYDVAAVDVQCQSIGETLRVGSHPFSCFDNTSVAFR